MSRQLALLVRLVLVIVGASALLWWYFERRAHYDEVQRRIDAAAPRAGESDVAEARPEPQPEGAIRIDVLPRTSDEPGLARYWIQLGPTAWDLAFPTDAAGPAVREDALEVLDRTMKELKDEIQRRVPAGGAPPAAVVRQPREAVAAIPPELMFFILDAVTGAGIQDLTLEATTQVAPGEVPR